VTEVIWPGAGEDDITIDRMVGGSYNRIIGVTRRNKADCNSDKRYVLRRPRFTEDPEERTDHDVAALLFVEKDIRTSPFPPSFLSTREHKTSWNSLK
jgi:hypothetical protein